MRTAVDLAYEEAELVALGYNCYQDHDVDEVGSVAIDENQSYIEAVVDIRAVGLVIISPGVS